MPDIEVDFPRGGVLANDRPARPSKRRAASEASEKVEKKKRLDEEYDHVFTKIVTRELLTTDVRGLGIVKTIGETEVVLETTHGIQLNLSALQISNEFKRNLGKTSLDEIFQVGQTIAFKVLKAAKSRDENPTVTIDPAAVNAHLVPAAYKNGLVINGSVVSVEEKGAVINVGTSSKVKGFVKSEDLPPSWPLDRLHVGQVLMFRVRKTSTANQRVLDLSAYAEMDIYSDDKLSLSDLMPGTIINVDPDKSVKSGVFVKTENENKIFIHKSHLPPRLRVDPDRFARTIRAIVICILPNSPLFVVSAHPDIVALSKVDKRKLPDEYRPGSFVECTVYDIDKLGNVYFLLGSDSDKPPTITAKALKAHFDDYDTSISKFAIGTTHKCRVVGYHALERVLLVSTKREIMKQQIVQIADAEPGQRLNVVVLSVQENGLTVRIGSRGEDNTQILLGHVPSTHVMDHQVKNWQKNFQKDQRLTCRVLFVDEKKEQNFAHRQTIFVRDYDQSQINETVVGTVIKKFESEAFLVSFYNKIAGIIPALEGKTLTSLKEGDVVKTRIARVNPEEQKILLTTKETSEVSKPKQTEKSDVVIKLVKKPAKPFQVCRAQVIGQWVYGKTSKHTTVELRVQGGSIGRLHVSEIDLTEFNEGSSPMTDFLHKYRGKFIQIKVISVGSRTSITETGQKLILKRCGTTRFVECTMVPSKIAEPHKKLRLINYKSLFERGDRVNVFVGDVMKMKSSDHKYIIAEINPLFFAHIPNHYVDRIKPSSDADIQLSSDDLTLKFNNGELLRGLVISQSRTARAKYLTVALGDCILKEEPEDEETSRNKVKKRKKQNSETKAEEDDETKPDESMISDPGFDFSTNMFSMENLSKVGKETSDNEDSDDEIKEEPEDNDDETVLDRERKITERERQLAEAIPENPIDFDRLLIATPSSSDLWIKYITYYLREENLEEARKIAERALESVNFREEEERFNVWTAYLNAEIMFGGAESWKPVFQRASNAMDSLKMHWQMVKILTHHRRFEELEELHEMMIKKFRHQDLEVWFSYAQYLYSSNHPEKARELMQRALNSMEKKQHLIIQSRFAKLECRMGDEERGKTMIQKILQTYPQKAVQRLRLNLTDVEKKNKKKQKTIEVENED
ncbi:Protein RRP5-like protein [Aphelenchoides besseyi]|nr:Protein RRP5-like protein [Aphelenchoides besseyi]